MNNKEVLSFIEKNSKGLSFNDYVDLIKKFEKQYGTDIEKKICFYRYLLNSNKRVNLDEYYKLSKSFLRRLNINNVKSIEQYLLIIDIMMITAIMLDRYSDREKALEMFESAIKFGNKYSSYSKENYYDALNCAYSWKGVYCYNSFKYEEALLCFNKIIDNYNYFVKEKDSVPISEMYIRKIKSIID